MLKRTSKLSRKIKVILTLFILLAFALLQNNLIIIHPITIVSEDIPEAISGYKILQISDLHNKQFKFKQQPLVNKINAEKPDMIVITGDLIDYRSKDLTPIVNLLGEISKVAPIYYVNGNHEAHNERYASLLKLLDQYNVNILNDRQLILEEKETSFHIIGLQDPDFSDLPKGYLDLNREFNLKTENFNILLSHRPELFSYYAAHDIDLVFAGHAHGGQFRIPFLNQGLIAPDQGFFPEYTKGTYERNGTTMVVSAGLGNSIIPLRLFNLPELVVTVLESN